MFKYEIGDRVIVVGNTNNDRHKILWVSSMNNMVGKECVIKNKGLSGGVAVYTLCEDNGWLTFDEEWLAPAIQEEADTTVLDEFFSEF